MKDKFKGWIGKLLAFIAFFLLLSLLFKAVPSLQAWAAKVTGKSLSVVSGFIDKSIVVGTSAALFLVAIGVAGALPIVAVAMAVVAIAMLAYTFWGSIFPSASGDDSSIGSEINQ